MTKCLFSSYCDIDTQGNKALVMKQYLSDEKVANFSTDEWYPASFKLNSQMFFPGSAILKSTSDKSWRQSTGCRDRRDLGDESDPSQKSDAQREEVWVGFWIIFVWFSFVQDSFCFWDGKEPRWSSGYPTGCFGWIGTGRSLFLSSQWLSVISSYHLIKWQFYSWANHSASCRITRRSLS